ncbi:type IV toxin-antitoxin system AbiEi family antitoxin domain-containing protein [Geodermatophilus marinus]|uniref:type IV toxin-antitoxin system AbiEi family antitoxin domain-containing protein n=1 Tax=Geodermatophilus sp. LHW52908 TaxID=2303986 RepID=UPI001F39E81E|nr:type IV toxin-antitoxin system AbiEi family antitoxin domain-containing protein [Geodermatophilus sp. LHW52908]
MAEPRFGVFTAGDAVAAGYAREDVGGLVARGRWVRLRRGVYADRAVVDAVAGDPAARHRLNCAAVLVRLAPGPAVSHTSAARVLGLVAPRSQDDCVRLTDEAQWRRGRGYEVTRASLPQGSVLPLGPFRVTAPARTLVDCARGWSLEDAVVAMDDALHRRLVEPDELTAAVLAQTHWLGIGGAARAAGLADGRAESPLETRGRLRILGSGLPAPELQVEIHDRHGFVGRVDGWYEEAAVAVEFDGFVKYEVPRDDRSPARVAWEEKRREDALRALDIRVVRIANADLGPAWPRVEERLAMLLATPFAGPRRFTVVPAGRPVPRSA